MSSHKYIPGIQGIPAQFIIAGFCKFLQRRNVVFVANRQYETNKLLTDAVISRFCQHFEHRWANCPVRQISQHSDRADTDVSVTVTSSPSLLSICGCRWKLYGQASTSRGC